MTKTLRELHEAATPAPWENSELIASPRYKGAVAEQNGDGMICDAWREADAALIAAMRNALPLLLDVVDAARRLTHSRGSGEYITAFDDLKDALAALDGAA